MASHPDIDDVRTAVSSTATCTPATASILKELLLSETEVSPAAKLQPTKVPRSAQSRPAAGARSGQAKAKASSQHGRGELSEKEKAALATHIINATLKSLGEAAKPQTPQTPSKRQLSSGDVTKPTPRAGPRRSSSAPMTPLLPRSLNRVSTSPILTTKPNKPSASLLASTGCLAVVECARVAFASLRTLQSAGKVTLPALQLEAGMSSFVGKLIGLGLLDQAVKELRILKRRLEVTPATDLPKASAKAATAEASAPARGFSDLLDYSEAKISHQILPLIVASQVQTLRILAASKKPAQIEAAVPFLRSSCKSSPLNLLLVSAKGSAAEKGKATRQIETLSQLLLSFTPSVSSADDEAALEPRLSVSPTAAMELQRIGLEARLHWWALAGHQGDADKDILGPLFRCLSAYTRRSRSQGATSYKLCKTVFNAIHDMITSNGLSISLSSKSPLGTIYQALTTLARESGQLKDGVFWATQAWKLVDPSKESAAKRCSASAQLLSLQLKEPSTYLHDDALLSEVLEGIQGPLRGDTTELEELLLNVCFVRKAAMNLLASRTKQAPSAQPRISAPISELLESFVWQCPRFCLRWLGKPPASKSSTKDFLRYEQRRQLLIKSMHHILDSALAVTKTRIDENRAAWELMDSVLSDCLTLLDYLGDLKVSDPAASYHVKISHFYYLNYKVLKQDTAESAGVEALRALRRSIECVKPRSAEEKEKSQLLFKLERLADICKALGRTAEALTALQSIRTSLVDDGALEAVATELASEPPISAWTSTDKATILSRTLISINKLEQVHLDWTLDMPETSRAAVLEHRLHLILLGPANPEAEVGLTHPCVEALLRIYYPTRFPLRRLRTLLCLLSINIDKPDIVTDIRSQIDAALGLTESKDLGEDAALADYLPHYQILCVSLTGLSQGYPSPEELVQCLSSWNSIVREDLTKEDLAKRIDNISEFLTHLQSIADFARTMGEDSILTTVLELSTKVTRLSSHSEQGEQLKYESYLAVQHVNAGNYVKAEQILDQSKLHVKQQDGIPIEGLACFHLACAEYAIARGRFDQANQHLTELKVAGIDSQLSRLPRARRKFLLSHASLLQSFVTLDKGDAHHALVHARNSVGILFQDWTRLEKTATPETTSPKPASDDTNTSLAEGDITVTRGAQDGVSSDTSAPASPEFWSLFYPLFRGTLRLSSIYAHLGLFQETLYYAEQARKFALSTNSIVYLAQSEAGLSAVWVKAGNLEKTAEWAGTARSRIRDDDLTSRSVALSCHLSAVYGELKDYEREADMLRRAETVITSITAAQSTEVAGNIEPAPVVIDKKTSKRSTRERPTAPARKPKAPATRKVPAKSTRQKAEPAEAAGPVADGLERPPVSMLEATITAQRIALLLNKREWPAAMALIQQVQSLSKTPAAVISERVAIASCLLGLSNEQMAKDAVFSVIQESTLAFPSVCSDKGDQLSLAKSSPPSKGRPAAASSSRDESRERKAHCFLEKLREAQEFLVEAHSTAAVTGDGSLLHRISGMLQNVGILLSAAPSTSPRGLGHPGYTTFSVEMARNLTWRRERKALLLEKLSSKVTMLEWPTAIATPSSGRQSLGVSTDTGRFQRDYVDIIPREWCVISISLSSNKHDLCITKLQAGQSPFSIRLPLERASSRDADNEVFNFHQGRSELLEFIKEANSSCHHSQDMSAREAKTAWWAEREALDQRLEDLLVKMEDIWLGGFRGIFSRHERHPDAFARFQKAFQRTLDKHLPSRRQVRAKRGKAAAAPASPKVTLDPRILELFIGLGDATAQDCDLDDALTDLLYFVVDILQFHGERNAYDEIDFDSMVVETLGALESYHATVKNSTEAEDNLHTVLVLDKALHAFPWESMPCMQDLAVSRVPSLACLRRLILEQDDGGGSSAGSTTTTTTTNTTNSPESDGDPPRKAPSGHRVSPSSGTYILNPSSDLKSTQATFYDPLASLGPAWTRIVSRAPTEAEFEAALAERDMVLYFGHGSGAQYIRGRSIRKLDKCRAAALLMGCSSASLAYNGEFEVHGPAWNYMLAGCPAVVGTLWDVTDRDIDRFAGRLFEEWGLLPRSTFAAADEAKWKANNNNNKKKNHQAGGEVAAQRRLHRRHRPAQGVVDAETSLVEAVAWAREVPRFRYLTAAAVCVYGIPVYLSKEKKNNNNNSNKKKNQAPAQ